MSSVPQSITPLLSSFICSSKDGYAIFDANDKLIFANASYNDIFCISPNAVNRLYFEDIIREAYREKRGIHIDTNAIEDWLAYVRSVRRKIDFRIFEVDLVDGRWMLFSEQILPSGEMLIQSKDITSQKVIETQLRDSVSTLHELALTDELTELPNRRSFVNSVANALCKVARSPQDVAMLVLDLDHFKKINDSHGHPIGDKYLKFVSKRLKEVMRPYDILGRLGGEEFAVFLTDTNCQHAKDISERLRECVEHNVLTCGESRIQTTVSIGMSYPTSTTSLSFESLYRRADTALYQAKANGRNCVVCDC